MVEIIWDQNPLRTKVILDDHDREILYKNILIEELMDHAETLKFNMTRYPDIESLERDIKGFDFKRLQREAKERAIDYERELQGIHCGDCTCVPMSCAKCSAEDLANVNTVPGASKHVLQYIGGCFDYEGITIDDAIEKLENDKTKPYHENEAYRDSKFTEEQYNEYAKGWEQQRKSAIKWLKAYKKEHFS